MKTETIQSIENMLEITPNSLTESDRLEGISEWDSLAALGFIALADKKFGTKIRPNELIQCKTVGDLVRLLSQEKTN